MTINILKRAFLAACLTAAAAGAHAAPKVTATIDSTQMEMGSRTVINVNVSDPQRAGRLIDLPEAGTENDAVDFIAVKGDTTGGGYSYAIDIQAFTPGEYTFEPFRYVVGGDTFRSNYLSLKVLPVDLDSLQTINPMESVVNVPRRWYDYIPDSLVWIVLGIALLAVIVALALLYKKNGTIIVRRPKPVDPYAEAKAALANLRERKLAENGQEKEFYTSLVDILRKYLERRFGIFAMEMSTPQILASLRENPETRNNQPRIKQILDLADFVKFANVRPLPDDNIKTFRSVEDFIDETKPVEPDPDEKDGKNTENAGKSARKADKSAPKSDKITK